MLEALVESRLAALPARLSHSLAVELPGGRHIGAADASVVLRLNQLSPLMHVASGQIGRLAADFV